MKFYLNSIFFLSIPLTLIAGVLTYVNLQQNGQNRSWFLLAFIVISTFFVYNLDKLKDARQMDHLNVPHRAAFFLRHGRKLVIFSLFLLPLNLYFFWKCRWQQMQVLFVLAGFSFVYFFLLKKMQRIPVVSGFLKPFFLGLVWAAVTILLPLPIALWSQNLLNFISVALLFWVNGLWFDFRDREGDRIYQKPNLSNSISGRAFFQIILAALLAVFLLSVYSRVFYYIPLLALYLFIFTIYMQFRRSAPVKNELFYDLCVDLPFLILPIMELWLV